MGVTGYDIFIFLTHVKIFTKRTVGTAYRTRKYLEETTNPATGEPFLKPIKVNLYGENDSEALTLTGNLKTAYEKIQGFCKLLSKRTRQAGFISTLMLRRIGSTITAGRNTAEKMSKWNEADEANLENALALELETSDSEAKTELSEVKRLTSDEKELLEDITQLLNNSFQPDPKIERLISILKFGVPNSADSAPWIDRGCIIFSQYYDSAELVAKKISEEFPSINVGLYAGGDKSGYYLNSIYYKSSKESLKKAVKNHALKILVGTDAASEGLNLQTLTTLINIDLPWNPTRLEQRKGRIQRIGQLADTVSIYNMRYKDSVEDKVHSVLSSRFKEIHDLFGQIPDTLEDIWIDMALNEENKAKELINEVITSSPFQLKYEDNVPVTSNWATCSTVLNREDKLKVLLKGW